MTTSDNEWYNKWQPVTTNGTASDNEWWRMTASLKTHEYEWENVEGKSEEVKNEEEVRRKNQTYFFYK